MSSAAASTIVQSQLDFFLNKNSEWKNITLSEVSSLASVMSTVVPVISTGGDGISIECAHKSVDVMNQNMMMIPTSSEKNKNKKSAMIITGNDRLTDETSAMAPCLAAFLAQKLIDEEWEVHVIYIAKEDENDMRKLLSSSKPRMVRLVPEAKNYVLWFYPEVLDRIPFLLEKESSDARNKALKEQEKEKAKAKQMKKIYREQHGGKDPPMTKKKLEDMSFTGRVFAKACGNAANRVDAFIAYLGPKEGWGAKHLLGGPNPDGKGMSILSSYVETNAGMRNDDEFVMVVHAMYNVAKANSAWGTSIFSNTSEEVDGEWIEIFEESSGASCTVEYDDTAGVGYKRFILTKEGK